MEEAKKEKWIKELKKKNLLVTKDEDYYKNEAKRFLRNEFMKPLLKGKQFFTQSEFENNQGKILMFNHHLRLL